MFHFHDHFSRKLLVSLSDWYADVNEHVPFLNPELTFHECFFSIGDVHCSVIRVFGPAIVCCYSVRNWKFTKLGITLQFSKHFQRKRVTLDITKIFNLSLLPFVEHTIWKNGSLKSWNFISRYDWERMPYIADNNGIVINLKYISTKM